MTTLLICNAQIVNEGSIQKADVFIREGRIARIGSDLSHLPSEKFIDATGQYLLPGMIDSQFSVVGDVLSSGKLKQECEAAVAGGITSIMLLPDFTQADEKVAYLTSDKLSSIDNALINNFSYYQAIKVDELDVIETLDLSHSSGLYVSMCSDDDTYRFDDSDVLEALLEQSPVLVAVHAENAPDILESEESYRQIYGDDIPYHLHSLIRSQQACSTAAEEVLILAEKSQAKLHLLHVSSSVEVELLEKYRDNNKNISADVCSHFLTFSEIDCNKRGAQLKYNPAIKTDIDRAALIHGLLDNNIDNICSGHIPVRMKDKEKSYLEVPAGLPQAQFALPSILEHFQDQILSLEFIVDKISHSVANRFSIEERGYIREGYWADLVLIDIERSFIARDEDVISNAGWTIFNGNEFRSSVLTTIVNGQVVWANGALVDAVTAGQLMTFDRIV